MITGDSLNIRRLITDLALVQALKKKKTGIELIFNKFSSHFFKIIPKEFIDDQIVREIIVRRIPVLQNPKGPLVGEIDRIRENNYLIDFRQKILSIEKSSDFTNIVRKVEDEFNQYRNRLLAEKHSKAQIFTSVSKSVMSFVAGILIPSSMEVKQIFDDQRTRTNNWTAFISQIELE